MRALSGWMRNHGVGEQSTQRRWARMKPYTDYIDPAEIVSVRRIELSLTQAELARKLGYPNVSFISMIEKKKSKAPLERAVDIAEALEMDPAWFIEKVMRDRFPEAAKIIY